MRALPASTAPASDRSVEIARAAVLLVLALGAVYWALGLWFATWPADGFVSRAGLAAGGDFIAFWGAATLAAQGDPAAPYDLARFVPALGAAVPAIAAPRFPWAYPPFVAVLLRPLGWLDPAPALALWYGAAMACAALTVRLVLDGWRLAPLAVVFPPVAHALTCGQNGPMSAALMAAIVTLWSRAPALAGAALGLLAYKPQFAAVAALLALALRAWRILAAAGIVVALLILLSLAIDGAAPWVAFFAQSRAQLDHVADGSLPLDRVVTIFALARALGLGTAPALALQAALAAAALVAVVALWRLSDDLFVRALSLTAATILVTPYAFDYDLAILLVPAAALFADRRAAGQGRGQPLRRDGAFAPSLTDALWFAALALTPVVSFVLVAGAGAGQYGAVVIAAMLAVLLLETRPGRAP